MLGRPAIYWQGKRIVFPFAKMEALLYYLLVQGQATRHELAGLLWSDMDDVTAKKNLRNTLYLLKKTIADELILTTGRLIIEINWKLVATSDIQTFNEVGEHGLNAYKGSFLEGFTCREAALFEEWIIEQREKYRESFTTRLTKHIVELMNTKKYGDAKQSLQRLIKTDEYNESAYRALMRIYEIEGSYNKSIKIYLLLKKKLASELGIAPNEKTKEIYERIQSMNATVPVIYGDLRHNFFFGRQQELNELFRYLDHLRSGSSSKELIILHGEQGVGKSALLEKFLEAAWNKEELVLQTQCYEPEVNYPYKAWSTVFGQVLKVLSETGVPIPAVWRQIIAYIFPSAVHGDGWQGLDTYFDGDFIQPGAIEEVLCGVLEKLSKVRTIILLIEDVHWMDVQGLSALKNFFRLLGIRLMCVLTCRSEYVKRLEQALNNMNEQVVTAWLEVEAFRREDVVRFSTLALPSDKIKLSIPQKLYDYTEGNALFLTECIKLIQLGHDVESLSPKLQSVLNARVVHLSPSSQRLLEVVSTFIREATYDTLVNICGLNELELVEAVDELLHKRLLVEETESELSYKFTHVLIRDHIYSKMSLARQKMIHQRIAVYLEEKMSAGPKARDLYSEVLHHYAKAGQRMKVLEYTIKLAERFSSPHYEMFPEAFDASRAGRGCMLTDRLQITNYLQEISGMLEALPQEAASEIDFCRYKIAYLEMLGRYHIWGGNHREGLKMIHELLHIADGKEDWEYLIKGYQQIAYCGIQTGKPKLVEAFAGKLLKTASALNLKDKMATALRLRGYAYAMQQDHALAEQNYRQSISLFRRLSNKQGKYAASIGAAYSYIGDIRSGEGKFAEALQYYEKAISLYSGQNVCEALAIIFINAGVAAFELEDYAKTDSYFAEALRGGEQFGGQMGFWCLRSHCILYCVAALIAVRQGNLTEGLCCLKRAECFFKQHSDWYAARFVLRAKTEIAARMEGDERIRQVFAEYLPLPSQSYYRQSREVFSRRDDRYPLQTLAKISFVKKYNPNKNILS